MDDSDARFGDSRNDSCHACGATVPVGAVACPACGEPRVASRDDLPLPPLPNGGLATLMPAWLREAPSEGPHRPDATANHQPGEHVPSVSPSANHPPAVLPPIADGREAATQAGETANLTAVPPAPGIEAPTTFDPASLITADDLPAWLRALGAPAAGGVSPTSAAAVRPLPPAERAASPVYLPRAQPRPVADAAPPDDRETAAERPMPAGAGAVADLPDAVAGVRSVPSTRESTAVAAGDDGAPPAVAAEANGTPASGSTATETANPATVAAVASADRDAAQADQPLDADPDGLLQDGVAAGIATIAILIVAAVIVFVVWRATTGP